MRVFDKLAKMPKEERRGMVLDLWESNRNINGFFNMLMSEAEPTAIEMMESLGWELEQDRDNSITWIANRGGEVYMGECGLTFGQQFYAQQKYSYSIDEVHLIEEAYAKLRKERGWEEETK